MVVGKCLVWGKPKDRLGPAEIATGSQAGRPPYRWIERTANGGQTIYFERPRENSGRTIGSAWRVRSLEIYDEDLIVDGK